MLHPQENAVEVDRHLSLEVAERHVQHRAGNADAGIVHQDVEAAVIGLDGGDHVDPGLLGGDVLMVVLGLAALPHDLGGQGLTLFILQVGQDDDRAFLGQPFGAGAPDTARAAGDQSHLALNPSRHAVPPWLSVPSRKTPSARSAPCPASRCVTPGVRGPRGAHNSLHGRRNVVEAGKVGPVHGGPAPAPTR